MSDLAIRALPPMGMISLRGDLGALGDAVGSVTGCAMPQVRMSTRAGDHTAMWMSPDEVLLLCGYDAAPELASRLEASLEGVFATVAVLSDARQIFDISGAGSETLLAKLMPVDFAKLGTTEVRRTRMAQVPAAIWRTSDGFNLICFRSVADYAMNLLQTARPTGG